MTQDTMPPDQGWVPLSEALLRGLVHAMNNRVTSMGANAELAEMDGEGLEPRLVREELARFNDLVRMISAVASRGGEPEALELGPLLDEVLRLHAHHPRLRTVKCVIEREDGLLPVRAPRWAMLRLVLLIVDQAKSAAPDTTKQIVMRLSGNASAVRLACAVESWHDPEATDLAIRCGGSLQCHDGKLVLELPSLLQLRRQEGTEASR